MNKIIKTLAKVKSQFVINATSLQNKNIFAITACGPQVFRSCSFENRQNYCIMQHNFLSSSEPLLWMVTPGTGVRNVTLYV